MQLVSFLFFPSSRFAYFPFFLFFIILLLLLISINVSFATENTAIKAPISYSNTQQTIQSIPRTIVFTEPTRNLMELDRGSKNASYSILSNSTRNEFFNNPTLFRGNVQDNTLLLRRGSGQSPVDQLKLRDETMLTNELNNATEFVHDGSSIQKLPTVASDDSAYRVCIEACLVEWRANLEGTHAKVDSLSNEVFFGSLLGEKNELTPTQLHNIGCSCKDEASNKTDKDILQAVLENAIPKYNTYNSSSSVHDMSSRSAINSTKRRKAKDFQSKQDYPIGSSRNAMGRGFEDVDLPETNTPQVTFRSVAVDILEKECKALCVLEDKCLSYRWSSLDNRCEFGYPTVEKCEKATSEDFKPIDCNINPSVPPDHVQPSNPTKRSFRGLPTNYDMKNTPQENDSFSNALYSQYLKKPESLTSTNEILPQTDNDYLFPLITKNYPPTNIPLNTIESENALPDNNETTNDKIDSMGEEHSGSGVLSQLPKRPEFPGGILSAFPLLQNSFLGTAATHLVPSFFASPASALEKTQEEIPSVMHGAANALKTFQSVLAAGDTVMKTFPVADMVRAGQQLVRNGFLNLGSNGGIKGGVPLGVKDKVKGATRPPRGVEPPDVFCYPQGMRCCVPQAAASKYQKNPPKLNGVESQECTAHYISNINKLCVTIMYEKNSCNQAVIVTESSIVYRNVMTIPDKTMNNAICECILPKRHKKSDNDDNKDTGEDNYVVPASARWHYSRNALEKEEDTKQRLHDTVKKLGNVAKTFFFVSDIVTKPYADPETAALSEGASSFVETITELGEGLQQERQRTALTLNKPR